MMIPVSQKCYVVILHVETHQNNIKFPLFIIIIVFLII